MQKKLFILVFIAITVLISGYYIYQSKKLKNPTVPEISAVVLLNKLGSKYRSVGPTEETGATIKTRINNWQIIFSKSKDLDAQIDALQEIANNLRIDEGKNVTIDLRFNKAIVTQ